MCGIFGILNKDGSPVDQGLVQSATQHLIHRGPDDEGFYFQDNIGLGHRRLSIIDLSTNARQPFIKHGYAMVYNGEIYNYKELRQELEKAGYAFSSFSDTEVILSAYDHWGNEMFEKFNGMWSFVIWDEKQKTLLFSRDRYGMKPLFIFETDDYLAFASEIKAFAVLPGWSGELDVQSVNEFLVEGILFHDNSTFYQNVYSIPAASWENRDQRGKMIQEGSHFDIDHEKNKSTNPTLTYQTLFSRAIDQHNIADVEVAAALSGGLDSSSIVAQSIQNSYENATFSYAPADQEFSEYEYVEVLLKERKVSNRCISPDFEAHMEAHRSAIIANEAPALSINLISSFLLYEEVRRNGYKVLLAGQGADELLLGYTIYYPAFLKYLMRNNFIRFLRESFSLALKYPSQGMKVLGRSFRNHDYGQFLKRSQLDSSREPESPSLLEFESLYVNYMGYGHLYALLQFEDRLSMTHGVEARLPFLDRDFANFLHSVPLESKIEDGMRKAPLRKAMHGMVPNEILARKDKLGFQTPEEKWIYQHKEFFREKIDEGLKKHGEWFEEGLVDFVEKALDARKHYKFVWRVFSFLEFLEVKL